MNQQLSQPAAKVDLRRHMPETAKWVADRRMEFGKAHVDDCLRRALKGEAGCFYAIERGQFLGTPFPAAHPIAKDQDLVVMVGASFAAFIATPQVQASCGTGDAA